MQTELSDRLDKAFQDAFMQPEIYPGSYRTVETTHGRFAIPDDACDSDDPSDYADYVEGDIEEISPRKTGWLARTSAPGYLDGTDWCAFATEDEAAEYLIETFGDDITQ